MAKSLTKSGKGLRKPCMKDRGEEGEESMALKGEKGVLLGDIKLLFRSLLYDRRSVEIVALALILRYAIKKKRKKKEEKDVEEEEEAAESERNI